MSCTIFYFSGVTEEWNVLVLIVVFVSAKVLPEDFVQRIRVDVVAVEIVVSPIFLGDVDLWKDDEGERNRKIVASWPGFLACSKIGTHSNLSRNNETRILTHFAEISNSF